MKKHLLTLGAALMALSATAQVSFPIRMGFEDSEKTTIYRSQYARTPEMSAFGDWVNPIEGDDWNEQYGDEKISGDYCFMANNALETKNPWDRGFKLGNLPVKENTPYRVSFWMKGPAEGKLSAWMSKGVENLDKSFVDPSGNAIYGCNGITLSGEWQHISFVAYYGDATPFNNVLANTSWMGGAAFDLNGADGSQTYRQYFNDAIPEEFFAIWNMYDGGEYLLDDILIEEGVTFNQATWKGDVIKLDFGYSTNIAELAAAQERKTLRLDASQFTVTDDDGNEVKILSVEGKNTGYVYIFLEDFYNGQKLNITYTPSEDTQLRYGTKSRPSADYESEMAVLGFENETAELDENMEEIGSIMFALPELISAVPEQGSFDLPLSTKDFTFNFDKPIDADQAIIKLVGPKGYEQNLKPNETGYVTTLTTTREGADLAKGLYTIILDDIIPERDNGDVYSTEITYNIGVTEVDPSDTTSVIYADEFSGSGAAPSKGLLYFEGNLRAAGSGQGSGSRLFSFGEGGQFTSGLYFRNWTGAENNYYEVGSVEGEEIHMTEGNHKVKFTWCYWKAGTSPMQVKITKLGEEETVLYENDFAGDDVLNVNGSTAKVTGAKEEEIALNIEEEGDYVIRFTPGTDEKILGSISVIYIPDVPGAEYKFALMEAVAAGQTQYATVDENPRYDEQDYENLYQLLQKYEDSSKWATELGMTSATQYKAAVEEVKNATSKANEYKLLVDEYDGLRVEGGTVQQTIERYADNKVAQCDCYTEMAQAFEYYKDKDLTTISELTDAIAAMKNNMNKVNNFVNTCIPALTYRIDLAMKVLDSMNPDYTDEQVEVLEKASMAVTDDDDLANRVKDMATYAYYKAMTADEETKEYFFTPVLDEESGEFITDGSYNFSFYLKNPNIYIMNAKDGNDITDEHHPGWTYANVGTGYSANYSTGWSWYLSEQCPVYDAMMSNWITSYDFEQTIEDLPAGLYTLKCGLGERNDDGEWDTYFYWQTSADDELQKMKAPFVGQSFPTNNISTVDRLKTEYQPIFVDGVQLTEEELAEREEVLDDAEPIEILDGHLRIGAHAGNGSHIFLNNFSIYLVGSSAAYNYEEGVTGVQKVNNSSIKSVAVYDLNGRQLSRAAKGVNIVKRTYNDGRVVVGKYLVK